MQTALMHGGGTLLVLMMLGIGSASQNPSCAKLFSGEAGGSDHMAAASLDASGAALAVHNGWQGCGGPVDR